MQPAPQPSPQEAEANQAFDALLWVLSRPGSARTLPDAGMAGMVHALIDRECRVHASDETLRHLVAQTGATMATLDQADHVFGDEALPAAALRDLRIGSDLYPDDGATLILPARLDAGLRLRLSGPGVDGYLDLAIGGLPEGFWDVRAQITRYPTGFELFLIDHRSVIGIPRSTQVEVL